MHAASDLTPQNHPLDFLMSQEKKTVANAAGNGVTASKVVSGAAEQVKVFEAVIQYRPLDDIKCNSHNARTHSPKQIQQISASIKAFGFVVPILVDEEGTILAGHGRAAAGRVLGMSQVPTVCVQHLTAAQKRAFLLADNRLAELSAWDDERLAIELKELSGLDLAFDFEVTGFDTVDLDGLEARTAPEDPPAEVVAPVDRSASPVTTEGDLWQLGNHMLLCANALEQSSYIRLLGEQRAQMVFGDVRRPNLAEPVSDLFGGTQRHHVAGRWIGDLFNEGPQPLKRITLLL